MRQMERYHSDPQYKESVKAKKARYLANAEARKKQYACSRRWAKNNPDAYRAIRRKQKNLPWNRMRENLRKRIAEMIKGKASASSSVGCDAITLRQHIETQFKPGMSWDNYGTEWHVDHMMPLAAAECVDHLVRLNHFTNLQPLWAEENIRKGASITYAPPIGTSDGDGGRGGGTSQTAPSVSK